MKGSLFQVTKAAAVDIAVYLQQPGSSQRWTWEVGAGCWVLAVLAVLHRRVFPSTARTFLHPLLQPITPLASLPALPPSPRLTCRQVKEQRAAPAQGSKRARGAAAAARPTDLVTGMAPFFEHYQAGGLGMGSAEPGWLSRHPSSVQMWRPPDAPNRRPPALLSHCHSPPTPHWHPPQAREGDVLVVVAAAPSVVKATVWKAGSQVLRQGGAACVGRCCAGAVPMLC